MSDTIQNTDTKELLNTGVPGDGGTADTIYDGGNKIIANFDQVYNTFSDTRLFGTNRQYLQATGAAQYVNADVAAVPGGYYTINTTDLLAPITVRLPEIREFTIQNEYIPTLALPGSKIVVIDPYNSWGKQSVEFTSAPGQTIVQGETNQDGSQSLSFHESELEVELIATAYVDNSVTKYRWIVNSKSINDISSKPSNIDIELVDDTPVEVPIIDIRSFKTVKYVIYAEEIDKITGDIKRTSAAEILLLSIPASLLTTEETHMPSTHYASVIFDSEDSDYNDLFSYEFNAYNVLQENAEYKPTAFITVVNETANNVNININSIDVI